MNCTDAHWRCEPPGAEIRPGKTRRKIDHIHFWIHNCTPNSHAETAQQIHTPAWAVVVRHCPKKGDKT
jgi:hypothetical protein